MKVAINCAFYEPKGGGTKEYIDNLVNNLAGLVTDEEIILYVLQDQLNFAQKNLPGKFKIKTIPFNSGSKLNRIKRSLFEQKFWRKEEEIEKFDIFHSPFFHSPRFKRAKILLTVHDLRLYRYPESYEFFRSQFLKRKVKGSIKNASHIITVSDFTKSEVMELCRVPENKITTIHEAINHHRFSWKDNAFPSVLPKEMKEMKFILSVGNLEPRKNFENLIDVFKKIKEKPEFKDLNLVIGGRRDHSYHQVLKLMESTDGIIYLDFLYKEELVWLYKNALLYVFPSFYEGFGFPPVEAGSLGTISAVSNVSSIPEICGEGAFYFSPYNKEEMQTVIERALTDKELALEIREKMQQRLKDFSWQKNAKETLEIYHSL